MSILPIGHEALSVRRFPVATAALLVSCLLVHVVVSGRVAAARARADAALQGAIELYLTRP